MVRLLKMHAYFLYFKCPTLTRFYNQKFQKLNISKFIAQKYEQFKVGGKCRCEFLDIGVKVTFAEKQNEINSSTLPQWFFYPCSIPVPN